MDQDNPKSRNKQHRSLKKKYNKHRPGVQETISKPKPVLESNWDRYEEKIAENKISASTDFGVLANAPISHGSHFQFKSDKDIALEVPEPEENVKLFSLDLSLLDKSLSTISFIKRSGVDIKYFTDNQKHKMNTLDDKTNDYLAYLRSYQKVDPDVLFRSKDQMSGDFCNDNGDTQDGSHIDGSNETLEVPSESFKRNEDDLEQWLDEILDD